MLVGAAVLTDTSVVDAADIVDFVFVGEYMESFVADRK